MKSYKEGDTIKFTLKPYEQLIEEGRASITSTNNGIYNVHYGLGYPISTLHSRRILGSDCYQYIIIDDYYESI